MEHRITKRRAKSIVTSDDLEIACAHLLHLLMFLVIVKLACGLRSQYDDGVDGNQPTVINR